MTRRIPLTAVTGLALTLVAAGAAHAATSSSPPVQPGAPATLSKAPDFTLSLLDGKTLSLADLKGKPVLVNFWQSG